MRAYLFVHPFLGLSGVASILTAFALQVRKNRFRSAHYAAGALALILVLVARTTAFWTVGLIVRDGLDLSKIFFMLGPHGMITFIVLMFLLVQTGLGLSMYFFKNSYKRLAPAHRINAYIIVGLAVLTLALGATTFVMLVFSG
jgi:hypothetical protein